MEFNFTSTQKIQVDALLHIASKSPHIIKHRKTSILLLVTILLIFSITLSIVNLPLGIIFFIISIFASLLFPKYLAYYYKKNYEKLVNSSYKKNNLKIHFDDESITLKSEQIESKIQLNNLESIIEIKEYFYIVLKSSTYLILPKNQANDIDTLRIYLKNICLKEDVSFNTELDWKWK